MCRCRLNHRSLERELKFKKDDSIHAWERLDQSSSKTRPIQRLVPRGVLPSAVMRVHRSSAIPIPPKLLVACNLVWVEQGTSLQVRD
jgi:hypothetical protein